MREVNSGIYAFDADLLRSALGRVSRANAQGEVYLTDVVAIARVGRPRRRRAPALRRLADRGRQRPGPAGPAGRRAQPAGAGPLDARRRHHRRPGDDLDRRRHRAGQRRDRAAGHPAARRDRGRQRLDHRAGHHADRCRGRAGLHRRTDARHRWPCSARGRRSGRSPTCAPAPPGGRRQDRHLRGDQERRDRRRLQGPAPDLRRRRHDRRRHEHRRVVGLRELRRRGEAPDHHRRPLPDRLGHHVRGTGHSRGRGLHRGWHSRPQGCPRWGARPQRRAAAQRRGVGGPAPTRHRSGPGRRAGAAGRAAEHANEHAEPKGEAPGR